MAIAGVVMALLLAAGGVVLAQQRSRVSDLEARLDMARAQSEQERSERGRVALEVDEQEGQVQLLRGRLERAERRERDQQSCISMLSDERSVGEQTVTFGFVTGVDDSSLRFAPAEWFVGDEANEAAADDGEIEPGESVPNDYYIRNDERTEVVKRLDERAAVVLSTADRHNIPTPRCVTPGGFRRAFLDPELWQESILTSPYWLVESDGVVLRLVEQYLP